MKNLDPVYLINDGRVLAELQHQGFRAYHADSIPGLFYALRAKYVFQTTGIDVPWWTSGGASVIQLWHSAAIKTFGRDHPDRKNPSLKTRFFDKYVDIWERLIVTSETERKKMSSAFRMDTDQIWITGYPRNDVLFSDIEGCMIGVDQNLITALEQISNDHKVVGYLPTWRDTHSGSRSAESVSETFDPHSINATLSKTNAYMVVKFHPKTAERVDVEEFERILQLPPEMDIMPVLKQFDVLITDYSSVYVDYLLLDRPVIFYPYDLEEYIQSRPLYHDYSEITPGPIARDTKDLVSAIQQALNGEDEYTDERQQVRDLFFKHKDGESCRRILNKMTELTD